MDDLEFDTEEVAAWFSSTTNTTFQLVRVSDDSVSSWTAKLAPVLRRCYLTDETVSANAQRLSISSAEVIGSALPDPGPVMSGDFGEIVSYLFHAATLETAEYVGVKKWRLKENRLKAAPMSDVIHLVLPNWPNASENDVVLCSEVKTKATTGGFQPIVEALKHIEKDSVSRLAKTLVWLRERALRADLGQLTVSHLDRFIKSSDFPPATRNYFAVAVVCDSLAASELSTVPQSIPSDRTLVVIVIPRLKETYGAVFGAAPSTMT